MSGTLETLLVDIGTEAERVVVLYADRLVLASVQALQDITSGGRVRYDPATRQVTLGTDGEGVGVVTYELPEGWETVPAWQPELATVQIVRVR